MSRPKYTFPRAHSWLCLLAAVPFVLTALVGFEYGGATPFALLAVLCIVQAVVPTRPLWYLVVLVNTGASAYMVYLMVVRDMFWFATGRGLHVLVGDDWLYLLPLTAYLVALTYGLYRTRARMVSQTHEPPTR